MAKDPAILFYTADFLTGTSMFTDTQRGQYIRLLCYQHQLGHLPRAFMQKVIRCATSCVWQKFEVDENGNYYNLRLDEEIKKREQTSEYQRKRVNRRWEKRKYPGNTPVDTPVLPTYIPDGIPDEYYIENENGINTKVVSFKGSNELNIPFEVFWNLYDKKVDKLKCEKLWLKLTDTEREDCIYKLPAYIRATPDKKFRRDPKTYLYNKSWNNEIIEANNGATGAELIDIFKQKGIIRE